MRTVSSATTVAWSESYKGGAIRPCARATIQKLKVNFSQYDRSTIIGGTGKPGGTGVFASMAFGQASRPVELPNIKSVTWNRTLDADTAECTLTLWNTSPLPLGQAPAPGFAADFDRPGYYTFDRGKPDSYTRWGTGANSWKDLIVPDRVIRTYEGYGCSPELIPELDTHLYQSGAWIIDDVDYSHDGIIVVRCRDYASVLLSQIMFPPVVPWADYPLSWEKYHDVAEPAVTTAASSTSKGSKWFRPTYHTDSNKPYIGKGIHDGARPYVDGNGAVNGHKGSDAMDSSTDSYWMSVGNMPSWSSAFEYVEGTFGSRTITSVKVKTWGGPYTCYVSVKVGGKWRGTGKIPYRSRVVDTNADINYVKKHKVGKGTTTEIKLPKAYPGATAVRVTFTDLYNSGIGTYKWRAGVRDLQVLSTTATANTVTTTTDGGTHVEGNFDDYSEIILWLLAWSGFFWPDGAASYFTYSNGNKVTVTPSSPRYDDVLPGGRIWGDWMPTGTYGVALGVEVWDKKPIMDGIRFIKDIVGFSFWVDETGGVVWRLPNVYKVGNYLSGADGGQYADRTSAIITIDENTTLTSLRALLSGRNIRERLFIANTDGQSAAVTEGFSPAQSGLRRVGGWTDQHFTTTQECQIMADLIAIRQMFEYRTDTLTIAANPAIQIDDQVRIYERTTAETYLHYVKSIASELDLTTGKWTYTLGTHWLGEDPGEWAFNRMNLSAETQQYLNTLI